MEAKSIIERDDNRRERDKCSYLLHTEMENFRGVKSDGEGP